MKTDNPELDFMAYDAEINEGLLHCDFCGEAIYEDYYEVDGDIYCEECMKKHFRKEIA